MLGICAVGLFGFALVVFSILNPDFNPLHDYVSKLGAIGQPYALWWNLISRTQDQTIRSHVAL